MLPSELVTSSAPGICGFRGSMASLHDPLPTLRPAPRGTQRTARGRCDSLGLHRKGLSPPTPCRSPGALPTRVEAGSSAGDKTMPYQGYGRSGKSRRFRRLVSHQTAKNPFLGETDGPFLGADLRTEPPGAQAGSRRLRAAGVDALTPPSPRRGWSGGRAGRLSRRRRPPGFRAGR